MRRRRAYWARLAHQAVVLLTIATVVVPLPAWGEVLVLKNGSRLEGNVGKIGSMGGNPLAVETAGEVGLKRILVVDDELRRTFVGTHQVTELAPADVPALPVKIKIRQRVAEAGNGIVGVGPIVRVTPFDEWGRRIFTMSTNRGSVDVVQGITEITPTYTKVEALQAGTPYVWSMRVATSSIPRDQLSRILLHYIDQKNPDDRLKIVRLYLQSERIQDARAELEQLIADFPELKNLQDQVKALNQLAAQRLLKEVELRREAGQHQLAYAMLTGFPSDGVAGETLLKVRDMAGEYDVARQKGERVLTLLTQHQEEVKEDSTRANVAPLCREIATELSMHTLDRMADYLRLADDPKMPPEQKLSLAISGWLMGSGAGVDNLAVALSLAEVRRLVGEYLRTSTKPERDAILAQFVSLEGATPANVAKIIAHMKPAIETPLAPAAEAPAADSQPAPQPPLPDSGPDRKPAAASPAAEQPAQLPKEAVPAPKLDPKLLRDTAVRPGRVLAMGDVEEAGEKARKLNPLEKAAALFNAGENRDPLKPIPPVLDKEEKPAAAAKPSGDIFTDVPGMLELVVPGLPEDPEIEYLVQLPPEYNPYRRYPCIVTLNGSGTTPEQQIDWWAGAYNPQAKTRYGQATRHGYIVVAPRWTREHQRKYEFTAREHAAVLYTLRDVSRRFSLDTDRVFLTGHSMGGDAAWDVALAHPDLWAGVMPIVATADKYVTRYWQNAALLPMYFVSGEKDGNKLQTNTTDWDRYLTKPGWDMTIVQYQGRGHEHFHDEIQRLFDWMNLHRRNFFPREFKTVSMRPWDNFFWWVEADQLPSHAMVLPAAFPAPKAVYPAQVEASVLGTNGVRVQAAGERITVYLAPEIVNFNERLTVTINGRKHTNISPQLDVLLEDVRTRGDRLHPFWAKVSM